MKETWTLTWKLFLISFIAALLLGGTYVITKAPIEEQQLLESTQARQMVLPDAATFEKYDMKEISANEKYASIEEICIGKDAGGNVVGATVKLVAKGYNPGINLTVGLDSDGLIKGLSVGSNDESPGLGANAAKPEFYDQFAEKSAPLSVTKSSSTDHSQIVAITGATKTSKGITNAVNLACECYAEYIAE